VRGNEKAIAIRMLLLGSTICIAGCDEEDINAFLATGIIGRNDGTVWKSSLDLGTWSGWESSDTVLIRSDEMVNKDQDGERVGVVRLQ
jgi:hypothetical protein